MTASEKRAYAVELMKSREKMNDYTQGSKRIYVFGYPDNKAGNTTQKGYSDCSAFVARIIKAVTGIDIGSNTSAQINNRNKIGIIVDQTDGYYPDEDKLLPSDCLYFKGNTSHPLDVGHVEMYTGENECWGHGSGKGPTKKNLKDYCKSRASSKKRYFMAIRWILEDDPVSDSDPEELREGMNDNLLVKAMQSNLQQLNYALEADGDFGPETKRIVEEFQQANGLPVTGVADKATLEKIDELLDGESDAPENEPEAVVPDYKTYTAVDGTWNVRSGPGTEYAVAGRVKGGDKLEGVDTQGWIPVMFSGKLRWISPKAVKKGG